jgi:VIT1/CCC1 family predicted Fe2+/Mn2+ transporter
MPSRKESDSDGAKPAMASPRRGQERILSPIERLSEVVFGLIMTLSITGAISVAEYGKGDVRTMLIGALGCNVAWGLVDALMYLVAVVTERYRALALLHAVRAEKDTDIAHRMIAARLPPLIAASIQPTALEQLRRQFAEMTAIPTAGLTRRDLLGALGVFLLVFLTTIPVVLPFLLPVEPQRALRLSNTVAVAMLFVLGYWLGKYVSRQPIVIGLCAVLVGAALVVITIALGG